MIEIPFAYVLDLIFGDPRWFPHPVKGIGWLIKKIEQVTRKIIKNERIAGVILSLSVIGIVWYLSFIVVRQAYSISSYLGMAFSAVLIYTSLAVRDLDIESMDVYRALERDDIISARGKLSVIVGRDTVNLSKHEIIRGAVETVSENIVDGIISPLFYAFIGGAPLALAYKAINTLDSMVGHKNERYKNFGWASAKIDDLANFIPARLSALFLPLAGLLAGKDAFSSWRIALRDGRKNPSPNSGIPEAGISGALGIKLGGLNYYNSKPIIKPFIGDDINTLEMEHIKESIKISYICSTVFLIIGILLTFWIKKEVSAR